MGNFLMGRFTGKSMTKYAAAFGVMLVSSYMMPLPDLYPVSAEPKQKSKPFMVMVNNHAAARPQSGLSQADVLYECLAEGGITRFLAVYMHEGVEGPIGPVRSIRPYFIDIGRMYGALQVHAGGSPDAYQRIASEHVTSIDEITNAGRFFWRSKARKAPHNLYTDASRLQEAAKRLGYDTQASSTDSTSWHPPELKNKGPGAGPASGQALEAWSSHEMTVQGKPAAQVEVRFQQTSYRVSYAYDAATGQYKRFVNGEAHMDRNNQKQLAAERLVVLTAEHEVLDQAGRLSVRLEGRGEALLFEKGHAYEAQWERENGMDGLRLRSGKQEWALPAGSTHILIVPAKMGLPGHVTIH